MSRIGKVGYHGSDTKGDDWLASRACGSETADLFHPVGDAFENNADERAKLICRSCPLATRQKCLQFGLDTGDRWGIHGGLTYAERQQGLRKMPAPLWPLCRNRLHEMTPSNTGLIPSEGWRHCKACRADKVARNAATTAGDARRRMQDLRARRRAERQAAMA